MFYTYILYSENADRYYVGHCEDLTQRLERHNNKMVLSTKSYTPWRLVYHETFNKTGGKRPGIIYKADGKQEVY